MSCQVRDDAGRFSVEMAFASSAALRMWSRFASSSSAASYSALPLMRLAGFPVPSRMSSRSSPRFRGEKSTPVTAAMSSPWSRSSRSSSAAHLA